MTPTRVNSALQEDIRLIQIVKTYPTLYDSTQRGYKDRPVKATTWASVADALGIEVTEAKNRWRYIRDKFVREKKLLLNEGEKVYQLKDPWPLLEELSFLWEFITHRKKPNPSSLLSSDSSLDDPSTGGNPIKKQKMQRALQPILPWPSPQWVSVNLDYDTPDGSLSGSGANPDQPKIKQELEQNEGEPESQLRRLLEDRVSEVDELHPLEDNDDDMDDLHDERHVNKRHDESKDEDELYFLSVAAAFKKFTPKMKALAKWKIQQVLYEVKYSQPGTSSPLNAVLPY